MADGQATRRPVLLTVSGAIPADLAETVEAGRRPEADYAVMRDAFDADLVDGPAALAATGRVGRLIHRIGGTAAIVAWFCFRRRNDYGVIVTDGEQVGLQGADNPPVNEGVFRRVDQFQLHAAFAPQHVNLEIFETGQELLAVIGQAPRIEHSKRAVAKELVQVAAGGALKHIHFQLRQHIH